MEPLVVEFEVAAGRDHAFETWVSRPTMWWPRSKSVSGDRLDAVVIERFVGGRVFERDDAGQEYDWGRVVAWDPPHRVAYTWHLFFDPSEATDVTVTFESLGSSTAVRLEQRGWERLGEAGPMRRQNTIAAWEFIAPHYAAWLDASDGASGTG